MFTINSKSSYPIFEQIIEQVGKYITLGILQPHDQLPTVRTLARDLGVNPNTVAKAYKLCEENELIYSQAGRGYFVSDTKEGVSSVLIAAYADLFKAAHYLITLGEDKQSVIEKLEKELI